MKEFNGEKFCKDIIELRGTDSQSAFAEKLGINRSTLSLLENGKQIPTLELFNKLCTLASKSTEKYERLAKRSSYVGY